ncbi:hypothetical protein [Sphingopyxis sp. PET50]|uniref:hypothetical protein n=1 Tax=Sphingopyxis sp. PET50 TaxID=2976533 RepID=UPI0021AF2D8F|nr:hypothetical protein [Sphingopyxis sp. PET50]
MRLQLSSLAPPELLRLHASIGEELRNRGIVRSSNNPVGDFAEYLFCKAFGWTQAGNSAKSADALCSAGRLYQVKSRRPTRHNSSRQLSAIRDLDKGGFDYLAGVIFSEDYSVERAAIIPYDLVLANASYVERTNSWKFYLRDSVWDWPDVEDVTTQVRAACD